MGTNFKFQVWHSQTDDRWYWRLSDPYTKMHITGLYPDALADIRFFVDARIEALSRPAPEVVVKTRGKDGRVRRLPSG